MATLTPFRVSFPFPLLFKTLPALVLPVVPFPPLIVSSWAIITGAITVTVTVAESQLVGFSISHIWYVRV